MRSDVEIEDKSDIEWTEDDCPVSMQSGRRRSKNKKSNGKRVSDGSTTSSKKNSSPKQKTSEFFFKANSKLIFIFRKRQK